MRIGELGQATDVDIETIRYYGAVGAVHAAVARFRLQHRMAFLALVEPLASVSRHCFSLDVAALWTRQRRLRNGGTHRLLPLTVDG